MLEMMVIIMLSGSTWVCNKIMISTIILMMTMMMVIMIMKCNNRYGFIIAKIPIDIY